jgi:Flp pilus assembly protein TadG
VTAYRLMLGLWRVTDRPTGSPRGRSRGQALVEFAVIIPVFLLLLFGLLDFGRVIYAQNTITQDAREAARAGLVAALDSPITTTSYQKIRDAALKMATGISLANANITGDSALGGCDSPLPADNISAGTCFFPDGVTCTDSANPPRVVVKISLPITLLTPIVSNVIGSSFTPTAQSTTYLPC